MPKRRNPFGECSPMQMKTHVGAKEFNMGASGQHNLKEVYERTRQLLFSGAQKSTPVTTDANDNHIALVNASPPQMSLAPPQPQSGQLTLDNEGQLTGPVAMDTNTDVVSGPSELFNTEAVKNGQVTFNFLQTKAKEPKAKNDNCTFCKKTLAKVKCNFCEKLSCRKCVQQCSSCYGEYCQICSTINYDEAMERIFCLNCES